MAIDYSKYEMTIGIECHVQLDTKTKLFSGADNDARDKQPNEVISPIDYGLPGMLPVLNQRAVELAVLAGKALNAKIANVSRFDRKHYFYPDLPKGYQISQMYQPIIIGGYVDVPQSDGNPARVRLHHAHIEEDAGKLTHTTSESLVDLNRAGTPLIEIVSEPDIHSAQEAKQYAVELHKLMTYAGVTAGDLYHGNMRFDVNISVALQGQDKLGVRSEIKNLNSFRSVERAAQFEYKRQVELLESGQLVVQETRGWDEAKGVTFSQRSKEDAQDYRYMPDPDIPPIVLSDETIVAIQAELPKLPDYYRGDWASLKLDRSVVETLLAQKDFAKLISDIKQQSSDKRAIKVAHWLASGLSVVDNEQPTVTNLQPVEYINLANMTEEGRLSSSAAKEVFNELINSEQSAKVIAESKKLMQLSDDSLVESIVDKVLADPSSAKSIEDIKDGQEKAIGFLVGQVMKQSGGQVNPSKASEIIKRKLGN